MTDTDELLARLSNVPMILAYTVIGWDEADFQQPGPEDGWSAAEILAHIRASDDILSARIYAILVRDNPPLPAFDDRQWALIAGYPKAHFRTSLTLYTLRRAELITILHRAAPTDWGRTGIHEERGQQSVYDIARHIVEHEEEHCAQLERLRQSRESSA